MDSYLDNLLVFQKDFGPQVSEMMNTFGRLRFQEKIDFILFIFFFRNKFQHD